MTLPTTIISKNKVSLIDREALIFHAIYVAAITGNKNERRDKIPTRLESITVTRTF
jgi:hypothetical protein